jgi:hypothetical protein
MNQVILLLALVFFETVTGLDFFRNIWRTLNKENSTLLDELNRIEEEIYIEKKFISNIDIIGKEMRIMNESLVGFNFDEVDLRDFKKIESLLKREYKKKMKELFDEEDEMNKLLTDDNFRIIFDFLMKNKLLLPNPILEDPRDSNSVIEAIEVKRRLMELERGKAKGMVDKLEKINNFADRIDEIFSSINFYEASQDYLKLSNHSSPELDKMMKVFEEKQEEKNELLNGIREMRTMMRVNKSIDGNDDWKMRVFGFEGGLGSGSGSGSGSVGVRVCVSVRVSVSVRVRVSVSVSVSANQVLLQSYCSAFALRLPCVC